MKTGRVGLFALLAGLCLAGASWAQTPTPTLTFRNDLPLPVVVQTVTVIRGAMRKDQSELLAVGESSTKMPLDGDKIITIYDGRSNKILYKNALKAGRTSLLYSITTDPRLPAKVLLAHRPIVPGP